jgi:hypothetical protein
MIPLPELEQKYPKVYEVIEFFEKNYKSWNKDTSVKEVLE